MKDNYDPDVVQGFGDEWEAYSFNSDNVNSDEVDTLFRQFFDIFPWEMINLDSVGFDLGCGSGRWSRYIATKVSKIICIDASKKAINVAKKNLKPYKNCEFYVASVNEIPIEDNSMDFGYSIGVLHHIPDTSSGIRYCISKLKKGAPFLIYLYYSFDNQPIWYRYIWKISDTFRKLICILPFKVKHIITNLIALLVYYPLSRIALLLEKAGIKIKSFPLSEYRNSSIYTMKSNSLDRFGTKIEKRFTKVEIKEMMEDAGLDKIKFSDNPPYWKCVGIKKY